MKLEEALGKMREGKKRNFVQTVDLIVNVKELDLKNPQNRFVLEVFLPSGRGKDIKVCAIGKSLAEVAKGIADEVVDEKRLEQLENDKRELKKLIKRCEFFIAEPQLMARIGKSMGKYLGPKNKMPKPVPPQADIKAMINRMKNTVRVVLKDQPVIQCPIGTEKMDDDSIKKNFEAVMNAILQKLPRGKNNIKSVYIKTTMGVPIKIDGY